MKKKRERKRRTLQVVEDAESDNMQNTIYSSLRISPDSPYISTSQQKKHLEIFVFVFVYLIIYHQMLTQRWSLALLLLLLALFSPQVMEILTPLASFYYYLDFLMKDLEKLLSYPSTCSSPVGCNLSQMNTQGWFSSIITCFLHLLRNQSIPGKALASDKIHLNSSSQIQTQFDLNMLSKLLPSLSLFP